MGTRHFNRGHGLAVMFAAAVLAGFSCGASGGLTLELTAGGSTPGNGKTITLANADIGNPTVLAIWATVSGVNGTSSDEGLQSVCLNFGSIGPILGNLANLNTSTFFHSGGSQNATPYGTPGDQDLGSTNSASAADWWIARGGIPWTGTSAASNGAGSFLLGSVTFTPTDLGSAAATMLQLNVRNTINGALWFEDAIITERGGGLPPLWTNDKNPITGSVTIGAPVIVVPEPASLGALAMAALPMLRRRRR